MWQTFLLVRISNVGTGEVGVSEEANWHWATNERPRPNSRIILLYEDGSGAVLGFWTGETLIDSDGHDWEGWREVPHEAWAYAPNGFKLWCECRSDDPFNFAALIPTSQGES